MNTPMHFTSQFRSMRLMLLVVLCIGLVQPRQSAAAPRGVPDFAAIDAYVAAERATLQIPGLALGIVHGDQIVHLQSFGVADDSGRAVTPQTPFYMGSVTKSFTALAILQLVEAGQIDLDAPVQRYLPWFAVADAAAARQITVRHLLHQTSGFSTQTGNRFWQPHIEMDGIVRQLRTMRLSRPVGQEFQYSNINYTIAGLIVEQASGQAYADYVQQHIFVPLAMHHSFASGEAARADGVAAGHTYYLGRLITDSGMQPPGYLPAGFLTSSAEDMSHYLIAQLNDGRYDEAAVLSPAGIATLHHPVAPAFTQASAYGMGWVIGPTTDASPTDTNNLDANTIWHSGDDTRNHAMAILDLQGQWGIILLANAAGYELSVGADEIARGVLNLVQGQQPPVPSVLRPIMHGVYWGVLLMPLLELIGIGWETRQVWRWHQRVVAGASMGGRVRLGWHVLGPILPNLLIAVIFLWGLPQVTGLPLTGTVRLIPDFGIALISGGLLGIGWSVIRTLWLWSILRYRHRQRHEMQQPVAVVGN